MQFANLHIYRQWTAHTPNLHGTYMLAHKRLNMGRVGLTLGILPLEWSDSVCTTLPNGETCPCSRSTAAGAACWEFAVFANNHGPHPMQWSNSPCSPFSLTKSFLSLFSIDCVSLSYQSCTFKNRLVNLNKVMD